MQKAEKLLEFYSSDKYKYNENLKKEVQKKKVENANNNNIISYKNTNEDIRIQNINKKNERINVSQSHPQPELITDDLLDYDEIIIPSLKNKLKGNNISMNQSLINNGGNSFDSLENTKEFEQEIKPLEQLSDILKLKYELLIQIVGEETIRKIFSKCMGYRKEGLKYLKEKIPEILNTKSDRKSVV